MTQEEKARRYDEALERAKKEWNDNLDNAYSNYREHLEIIFPELAESEDERIRKDIISYLQRKQNQGELDAPDWIAWLEKQGEQKPTDKVEPKFKESMTDYERGYIDGRKAMAEKIQIILNAILFDNEKDDNYNHPALGCISQSRADD